MHLNKEWHSLFKDEIRNSIAVGGVYGHRQELIDVLEHNKRTDERKAASILGYFESASAMYEYAANQYKENEFSLRMADIKQIHSTKILLIFHFQSTIIFRKRYTRLLR